MNDIETIVDPTGIGVPHRARRLRRKSKNERVKEKLELEKLKSEVAEADARKAALPARSGYERDKERLELARLEQDLQHKNRMDRLLARKTVLELKEKRTAVKYGLSTATWDVLKYAVTVVPVLVAIGTFYLQYEKDVQTQRRLDVQERKIKLDEAVVKLVNQLSSKNPREVMNAAALLHVHGQPVIRIILPYLQPDWNAPYLVQALVDIVAAEEDKSRKAQVADEVVSRIADQTDRWIDEFLAAPAVEAKRDFVKVHIEAVIQLSTQCATACESLKAALKEHSARISVVLKKLEGRRSEFDGQEFKELMQSVSRLRNILT